MYQPVEWQEWGEAAFEKARQQDKPILLDIGAVWCHWCHVMDRESYENVAIASLINQNFVPIKVDRDERPDIDVRYQAAVQALSGQGGWPLTAFLTPEGKPFYGGTYFPPEDRWGRPGLPRLLEAVAQAYRTQREEILRSAEEIAAALSRAESVVGESPTTSRSIAEAIIEGIERLYDARFGGFGAAPKFPHPSAIDLLLDAYTETRRPGLLAMVTTTLEHMGRGGVYDQLGGGFHRYSVDERWIVPHFEKMCPDNASLLGNYLRAYQLTGQKFFREIATGIISYVLNVLSAPEGGFFASQDADSSLEDDGDYFTWTLDELSAVLDATETAVAAQRYHIEPRGEMQHNPAKNVLFVDQPFEAIGARLGLKPDDVASILDRARLKLLQARARRPTPFVDTTLYTGWNGMMISALLQAYKVLGLEEPRRRALDTLDLLMAKAYDAAKGMYHSLVDGRPRIEGLVDDQVFMVTALLDAFEVTGERTYFEHSLQLMERTLQRFWDSESGGFFDVAKDGRQRGGLFMLRKPFQDSPTPAANSIAGMALNRLALLADRPEFRHMAQRTLDLLAARAADYGIFAAAYARALLDHYRHPTSVFVVGQPEQDATQALLRVAYRAAIPGKRVFLLTPRAVRSRDLPAGLERTLPYLSLNRLPVALLCVGFACRPPVHSPDSLAEELQGKPS